MNTENQASSFTCPRPDCAQTFTDVQAEAGSIIACQACQRPMNARPQSMEAQLVQREQETVGGEGSNDVRRIPLAVLADNIRSMWNVGSIFRTCDACGVEQLVLSGISGTPPQISVTKVALGAEKSIRWSYRAKALHALKELEAQGYTPVALETGENVPPLHEFTWPPKPCLVIGHEVRGISPEVLDAIDKRVCIPMWGIKASYNVAVAFGIAAQHASTQLRLKPD